MTSVPDWKKEDVLFTLHWSTVRAAKYWLKQNKALLTHDCKNGYRAVLLKDWTPAI